MASSSQTISVSTDSIPAKSRPTMAEPRTLSSSQTKTTVSEQVTKTNPVSGIDPSSELMPPLAKKPALEARYNELLKVISEVGKDIKPAYTNSKSHSDRLRKNIVGARSILRECLSELDKISRNDMIPKNSNAMELSISTSTS